jgi:ubiquinone/menaquinone biosynthesis C-methylase UbiE
MERLSNATELLDGPLDDPASLAGNLRDLRRINRLLGGAALSRRAIDRLVGRSADGREVAILDVGTGAADIPVALLAAARRRGQRLRVVAADARPEVIAAAHAATPGLGEVAGLSLEVFDGRAIPYPDGAFDVAHTSLVIHHLDPDEAAAMLREMARVARLGIVVNDVSRGWIYWLGAWLVAHLFTLNRFTRHDAPLSVRRGYTIDEMRTILVHAGLHPIAELTDRLGARYAIAAVAK